MGATVPSTQPGGVVVLEPGAYSPAYITTPNITIRSRVPLAAVIDGAPDRHGIEIRAFNVTIDGVKIVGAGMDGIKTYSAFTTLKNCLVSHAGGQGIAAHDVYGVRIENCRIVRCGTDPLYDHGIYADGVSGTITGCTISGSSAFGICLYPAAMGWKVENNTIDGGGPGCSAILFQGSGTATGNRLSGFRYGLDWRGIGPFTDGGNVTALPDRRDFLKGVVTTRKAD